MPCEQEGKCLFLPSPRPGEQRAIVHVTHVVRRGERRVPRMVTAGKREPAGPMQFLHSSERHLFAYSCDAPRYHVGDNQRFVHAPRSRVCTHLLDGLSSSSSGFNRDTRPGAEDISSTALWPQADVSLAPFAGINAAVISQTTVNVPSILFTMFLRVSVSDCSSAPSPRDIARPGS